MFDRLNDYLIRQVVSRLEFEDALKLSLCCKEKRLLRSALGTASTAHWPPVSAYNLHIYTSNSWCETPTKEPFRLLLDLNVPINSISRNNSQMLLLHMAFEVDENGQRPQPKDMLKWLKREIDLAAKSMIDDAGEAYRIYENHKSIYPTCCEMIHEASHTIRYLMSRFNFDTRVSVEKVGGELFWTILKAVESNPHNVKELNIHHIYAKKEDEYRFAQTQNCFSSFNKICIKTDELLPALLVNPAFKCRYLEVTVRDDGKDFFSVLPNIQSEIIRQTFTFGNFQAAQLDDVKASIILQKIVTTTDRIIRYVQLHFNPVNLQIETFQEKLLSRFPPESVRNIMLAPGNGRFSVELTTTIQWLIISKCHRNNSISLFIVNKKYLTSTQRQKSRLLLEINI
ncbi:hypothetical protein WR25_19878 [Diploscapter pachys]|uniref:F-box domain-containing protein n=1 Tax=Diploscapter pachys TaxID=2018661 RepID=A0A2A2LBA3_9BILA|nr:hypothetical protein WR25_19878 [Diploscapter pachys]